MNDITLSIYGIRHVDSDDYVYVGQTRRGVDVRFRQHIQTARRRDVSRPIYQWIRAQSEENVTFDVLEEARAELVGENWLDGREIHWIAKLRTDGHLLMNLDDGGSHDSQTRAAREKRLRKGEDHYNYGKTHSEETRQKLSQSRRARAPFSDATRRKMSESMSGENNPNFGKTFSEETRQKMSESAKGNTKRRGAVQSEETKQKLREARANQAPASEETRRKISEAHKGKIISPEHRAKISAAISGEKHHAYGKRAANKGVPMSDEQKEKLKESRQQARCLSWHGKRNYVDPECEVCATKVASGEAERFSTKDEIAAAKAAWKAGRGTSELSAKLSAQRVGRVASDETRAKLSAARKGRPGKPASDETRAKQSAAKKGRVLPEETKRRMREGHHKSRHTDKGITKPGCEFCA